MMMRHQKNQSVVTMNTSKDIQDLYINVILVVKVCGVLRLSDPVLVSLNRLLISRLLYSRLRSFLSNLIFKYNEKNSL